MRLEMLDKKFPTLPKEYAPFFNLFFKDFWHYQMR